VGLRETVRITQVGPKLKQKTTLLGWLFFIWASSRGKVLDITGDNRGKKGKKGRNLCKRRAWLRLNGKLKNAGKRDTIRLCCEPEE